MYPLQVSDWGTAALAAGTRAKPTTARAKTATPVPTFTLRLLGGFVLDTLHRRVWVAQKLLSFFATVLNLNPAV